MLKRIYINNFRGLTNFELSIDSINLFLGPNGAGKSSVFDVLRKIQAFISGDDKVTALFKPADVTRWQDWANHSFELEIEGTGGTYKYELAVVYESDRGLARVAHERLWFDNRPLLKFEVGDAHLYRDNHSVGPTYPFDWDQSAVAVLPSRPDNTRLTWFKERMKRFVIVQPNPMVMVEDSDQEEAQLSPRMENFVSWYRYISQDQGKAIKIIAELRKILDGFDHFRFIEEGEQHRALLSYFSGEKGQSIAYRFNELSDGQRILIALYTLIHVAQSEEDYTLCIDEPENFIALPEIQPWLTLLYDLCSDGELQALLISHHPELIDYLAASAGHWFERDSNTPVRVKRITDDQSGVPISELVARGWLHG